MSQAPRFSNQTGILKSEIRNPKSECQDLNAEF